MVSCKAFIDSYKDNHSSDEVKHIDLFKEDIPVIDKDVLTGWGKLRNGDELNQDEQQKVDRFSEILEEFLSPINMFSFHQCGTYHSHLY